MSDVADKLHRPQTSVRVKAKQLGINFVTYENAWTIEKDILLKQLWDTEPVDSIASKLNQSRSGVYSRAKFLGLSKTKYKKPSQLQKSKERLCINCKNVNDRSAPSLKCSNCFKGPRKPKGTGWVARRCKNCDQGYSGKTREFCIKDCKSEFLTKERMKIVGNLDTLKQCKACSEEKVIWLFNLDSSRKDKVHPYCRECQKTNKQLTATAARNRRLLNFYGITLDEYDLLLKSQNGHCAMCPAIPLDKNLAVDHDHNTGAVRGLLCLTCNKYKLGQLTITDVDNIYNYLHNPPANKVFGAVRYVPEGMEKPKRKRKRRTIIPK